ncbi:cytochrome c1 [Candidatus Nitrosoglobus terrae]|uniref:Cytochrome c1 n=1 Tax=Candidatus Nitrosoglobus terrae TaxID=1630141 RepID=A0A1Q2SPT5_9GAMM|nr:cytochrome c1 [Candidatus Nitrosoglobus terrae]BAW81117.1 cytochrome c1 [Candidatus Nitrosoglobus terrae]
MKRTIACLLLFASSAAVVWASSDHYPLDKVKIDLHDKESLQRGAKTFVDYCVSCHSAKYMRYSRMAEDLGLTTAEVTQNFMLTTNKIHDPMEITMRPEDSKAWFGATPPDLTLVARYKGPAWLHTYLRTYYLDPGRPTGVNNLVFKDTAMPNPLWPLQGWQTLVKKGDESSDLKLTMPGAQSPSQYEQTLDDLVNFLTYMGEPAQLEREKYGPWVLIYLAVFCVIAYFLKKEYWKDVH